jgi:hypothetical protein
MTQQPSQNKQILQKLDEIVHDVGEVKEQISSMKKQIEMQPLIDQESHKAIADRFCRTEDRIKKLEEAQLWAMRLIIGTALSSLVAIVLAFR